MRNYFCGWYYKCQSPTQTLAVIQAVHGGSCSIQLITDNGAWNFSEYSQRNTFSPDGFTLDLHGDQIWASGEVRFSKLSPLRYDIMGPFRFVPFMECRHSVVSMCHCVNGRLCINGEEYRFHNALGYIEGDRGRSFPRAYIWTQCFFDGGSLMLSAAEIPFAGLRFTGVICAILFHGKEYRIATYLGAKAEKIADGEIIVRQGRFVFSAALIEKQAHPLNAPVNGNMSRTIHESASCRAAYRFEKDGQVMFEFQSNRASFEFEYRGNKGVIGDDSS